MDTSIDNFAKDDAEIVRDILRSVLYEARQQIDALEPPVGCFSTLHHDYTKKRSMQIVDELIKLHTTTPAAD